MRFAFPFRSHAGRSLRAVAALLLLAPLSVAPSRAQTGQADQHAALSSGAATRSDAARPDVGKPAAMAVDAAHRTLRAERRPLPVPAAGACAV